MAKIQNNPLEQNQKGDFDTLFTNGTQDPPPLTLDEKGPKTPVTQEAICKGVQSSNIRTLYVKKIISQPWLVQKPFFVNVQLKY